MIDLCIALNGPHVGVMLPFFMDSLRKTANLEDVRLHFVNKGCSDAVSDYLESLKGDGAEVYSMDWTYKETNQALRDHPIEHIVADCAGTCAWMVDNCGSAPWCFICHFDIEFHLDLIGWYVEKTGPLDHGMGQVGSHGTGLVGYRRMAVKQCGVNFSAISGFCLVQDVERGVMVVRHGADPRCLDRKLPIHGFDIGELMELNIMSKGWGVFSPTATELNPWRCHLGTGSGHTGDLLLKRAEAITILNRRGLVPLE